LYDYGARFYDPLLGRFISADTVVPGAGNPQALNRYAYVLNNPLRYTDPSGHWIFENDPDQGEFESPGIKSTPDADSSPALPVQGENTFNGYLPSVGAAVAALKDSGWEGDTAQHLAVQIYFCLFRSWGTVMEVGIPGAGPSGTNQGRADLYNLFTGDVWEVKPDKPWWHKPGREQLWRYIGALRAAGYPAQPGGPHNFVVPYVGGQELVVTSYPTDAGMLYYRPRNRSGQPEPVMSQVATYVTFWSALAGGAYLGSQLGLRGGRLAPDFVYGQ